MIDNFDTLCCKSKLIEALLIIYPINNSEWHKIVARVSQKDQILIFDIVSQSSIKISGFYFYFTYPLIVFAYK